jgi:hypothetical protein
MRVRPTRRDSRDLGDVKLEQVPESEGLPLERAELRLRKAATARCEDSVPSALVPIPCLGEELS